MEGSRHYRPPSEKVDLIRHRKRYDVFLSFRGSDVRDTLVKKLFQSLQEEGLHVFLDSERLEKGEDIGMSLEEAIKDSRVLIPIFSSGYASSAWCLKELSLMWSCRARCAGTHIIPLFYDVEPWQVRYPDSENNPYAEALKKHSKRQSKEEIEEWKAALNKVSHLSGWDLKQPASSDEDKLVQVRKYLQEYKIKDLHVAKHPVGLDARTSGAVKELLGIADCTRRVTFGIWGMGGLGKTTFAKSIYNQIHHNFQASCFVADIRAIAKESAMGLTNLQKQILKNLIKSDEGLDSVDEGKTKMHNRLKSIKALVVLDDVDHDKQLDALLGDWYGPGSIIIITTRDKEVLPKSQVDKIQAMESLSPEEGVKLFSWHAFGRENPQKDYGDITRQIVNACGGLPLSVEILGAHLRSKMNLRSWNEALQKIQKVGYYDLYKSLKISYDALTPDEKQIFLDIACFFNRSSGLFSNYDRSKEFYLKFWEVVGREAVYTSLENLEGKSLIVMHEYTQYGQIRFEFRMHDHLRDLGRQIAEEESRDKPLMRSRLWHEKDIISAIDQAEETSTVQGIMWSGRNDFEVEQLDSLSSMHNLKFMFYRHLFLKREITKLPQNLRYLFLLDLRHHGSSSEISSSTQSYYCPKAIGQLKYLCYLDMRGTPLRFLPIEFGQLRALEELHLNHCSLVELPRSFGNLTKLKFLDISDNKLKSLPANFSQLRSLEHLDAGRNDFEKLPALPAGLIHLSLKYFSSLIELPFMSHMRDLDDRHLPLCKSLIEIPKLDTLHSLRELTLDYCGKLKKLPALPAGLIDLSLECCSSLTELPCMSHITDLETLDLSECESLVEIPKLDTMHSLRRLKLDSGLKLEKLPALPAGLIHLSLKCCLSLIELPCMSHMTDLEILDLSECESLVEIPKLDTLHSLIDLTLDGCRKLEKLPALPAGPIDVSTRSCDKLQNKEFGNSLDSRQNSCTDKPLG